jgi:predicted 3-demethylubiquinone-9 3-methyltransferase (glyoxalase superfamily)
MAGKVQRISTFLWYDHQAEEAAKFYTAIFPNSSIGRVFRVTGCEPGDPREGSVMSLEFTLDGVQFGAINGGPMFKFTEAISLAVRCETQAEVDYYWERLSEGGDVDAQQCGWLKDKFGLSWQVVPEVLLELLGDPDPARARRTSEAMMTMKKLDIEALRRAAAG